MFMFVSRYEIKQLVSALCGRCVGTFCFGHDQILLDRMGHCHRVVWQLEVSRANVVREREVEVVDKRREDNSADGFDECFADTDPLAAQVR
jgi:hypothetical protein